MKAVYERRINGIAVFILDETGEVYYVSENEIPVDLEIGEVVKVRIENKNLTIIKKLPKEKNKRLEKMQKKREKLLKRKRE